jgi:hypothetical protein
LEQKGVGVPEHGNRGAVKKAVQKKRIEYSGALSLEHDRITDPAATSVAASLCDSKLLELFQGADFNLN